MSNFGRRAGGTCKVLFRVPTVEVLSCSLPPFRARAPYHDVSEGVRC